MLLLSILNGGKILLGVKFSFRPFIKLKVSMKYLIKSDPSINPTKNGACRTKQPRVVALHIIPALLLSSYVILHVLLPSISMLFDGV